MEAEQEQSHCNLKPSFPTTCCLRKASRRRDFTGANKQQGEKTLSTHQSQIATPLPPCRSAHMHTSKRTQRQKGGETGKHIRPYSNTPRTASACVQPAAGLSINSRQRHAQLFHMCLAGCYIAFFCRVLFPTFLLWYSLLFTPPAVTCSPHRAAVAWRGVAWRAVPGRTVPPRKVGSLIGVPQYIS